ncbi:hypothetical protein ACFTWD_09285 [Streptomyces sp. NPDC056943]|uniref:hypothetical protein n=1 Tax=Streptomyces sp. NPDC056943 TaxID=3345971 RepID=UPI00363C6B06
MKKTFRDNWRVVVEIMPRAREIRASQLGFTGLDYDLNGRLTGEAFEMTFVPRDLGDIGSGFFVSGHRHGRDVDAAYRARCEEMLAEFRRCDHVLSGRVECDEEHRCSHCDLVWEVLTADEAADGSTNQDAHSVEGEPVCCEAAINEFRTERSIPLLATAGGAA